MPQKIRKICRYPGCCQIVLGAYCDTHSKNNDYDKSRVTSCKRGYDNKWQKARSIFLRNNPLCVECHKQGLIESATVVDHIVPHKGDKVLFSDVNNWQALCKRCHSVKTAKEDGRWDKI